MDKAERKKCAKRVLACLNCKKRRCTYGALGGILGVVPRSVGQYLGNRRRRASWVVRKDTGTPSSYAPDQLAAGLCDGPKPISCPEKLRRLVGI